MFHFGLFFAALLGPASHAAAPAERAALLNTLIPRISQLADAPADAGEAAKLAGRLASVLDLAQPTSVNNSMTLRPLLKELEREPAQDDRALASALLRTREVVNEEARAIALAVQERRLNPYRHGPLVELNYRRARQIDWYERVYLTSENDRLFEQAWAGPHGLQAAHGKLLRNPRVPALSEDAPQDWGQGHDGDLDLEPLGGPRTLAQRLPELLSRLIGRDPDLDPAYLEQVMRMRERFHAARGAEGIQRAQYPLNVAKLLYLHKMEEIVASEDAAGFDLHVWGVYGRMESEIRHHILPRLRKIGRLGPRSREILSALREQNTALFNLIDGMDTRESPLWDYRDNPTFHRKMSELIDDIERKFARKTEKSKKAAERTCQELQTALKKKWDLKAIRCFLTITDYYERILRQARKDIQDPAHKREVLQLMREDDPAAPSLFTVEELKKGWHNFLLKREDSAMFIMRAVLPGLALPITPMAFNFLPFRDYNALIILAVAIAIMTLVARNIYSLKRARNLFARLDRLFWGKT